MLCNEPILHLFSNTFGLVCYSFGLRDGGFSILNLFGVTSSIDNIQRHEKYWAKKRNPVDELNRSVFLAHYN